MTAKKKPAKKATTKKAATKAAKKTAKPKKVREQFTVTTFTERGAVALKKTYERAGYKFVKSKITPDQVFLTFEDKE